MIETIATGLGILSSITGILSSVNQCQENDDVMQSIRQVERMVEGLRIEISQINRGSKVPPKVLSAYNKIIDRVRNSPEFSSHLTLTYTPEGLWIVGRKKRTTILRDPCGEYEIFGRS